MEQGPSRKGSEHVRAIQGRQAMNSFAARRRLTGAILALSLQALFLALLIQSMNPASAPERLVRELTLILPRLRKTQPPLAPASATAPPRTLTAPLPAIPFTPSPNAPAAAPPDIRHLGQSIFGCAPENYANLTPEQRALCPRPGEGVAIQNVPAFAPRSEVKDSAHWAAELEKRNSPFVDTCMTFQRHAIATSVEDYTLMVDPSCTAKKLQKAL